MSEANPAFPISGDNEDFPSLDSLDTRLREMIDTGGLFRFRDTAGQSWRLEVNLTLERIPGAND